MTREEKADKLGQEYFPDEYNIWARPNCEAQYVANACVRMAEWERKRLVDMACEWLKENVRVFQKKDIGDFILANFRKAMEE